MSRPRTGAWANRDKSLCCRFDVSQTPRAFRRKSLAASLLAAFALSANAGASQQPTPVWTFEQAEAWYPLRPVVEITQDSSERIQSSHEEVNSFTDAHAGKPLLTCDKTGLRNAIANAASGDVLDLTACSEITLTTGQINVLVDDLTLQGPGLDLLSIKGGASTNHFNRIFRHTGIGTLLISRHNADRCALHQHRLPTAVACTRTDDPRQRQTVEGRWRCAPARLPMRCSRARRTRPTRWLSRSLPRATNSSRSTKPRDATASRIAGRRALGKGLPAPFSSRAPPSRRRAAAALAKGQE